MEITVQRRQTEDQLVFTITCNKPTQIPFTDADQIMMQILQRCMNSVDSLELDPEDKILADIKSGIHNAKNRAFTRFWNQLRYDIKYDLETKWGPIVEEIYNWIVDAQSSELKMWMQEFDPQRTKYYFANDKTIPDPDDDDDEDE